MGISINIKQNNYNFNLSDLVVIGKRVNNKKRNFLFISKVLGKHIEVKPSVCKDAGKLLASLLYKKNISNDERICVLGFAETATGLGMAVAANIPDSFYITTTREEIIQYNSILKFEEEHSHATTHKCFINNNEDRLINADTIILVDDEITTGQSMINIIKELTTITNTKKYTILTILDWRNDFYKNQFKNLENDNNINIDVLSVIAGEIEVNDTTEYIDNLDNIIKQKSNTIEDLNMLNRIKVKTEFNIDGESYIKSTGRFGVTFDEIQNLELECKKAAEKIHNIIGYPKKILVLGHGENIYIPSRVANYLQGDVFYKSTTRSPIYCSNQDEYPIKQKDVFFHKNVKYYFYNKDEIEKKYDKVILLTEDDLNINLTCNMILVRL